MPELYLSTDVETEGPIPGPHSMLSFATVAFDASGVELGSFTRNLETLPGASGRLSTMAWWAENYQKPTPCPSSNSRIAKAPSVTCRSAGSPRRRIRTSRSMTRESRGCCS